jgi:hypothetical protein
MYKEGEREPIDSSSIGSSRLGIEGSSNGSLKKLTPSVHWKFAESNFLSFLHFLQSCLSFL